MYCVRNITEDLYWVGGNDRRLALFENIHPIEKGVSYNSYLLLDEKTVLFDTVDWSICRQFLENIKGVLGDRNLDYMVINHMEPDHAASIDEIILRYPDVKIICTEKASMFMHQFDFNVQDRVIKVKEGDTASFGKHKVAFMFAPMVHWPEVMVTYDTTNGMLFAADAFGTFGALDGKMFNDEVNFDRDWIDEARRYYTNIVGKYGAQVQALLKKAKDLDIKTICPLHGPVWRSDLGYFLDKYDKWSRYEPEEKGVMIVYGTMYGNTEAAANNLATELVKKGITNVAMYDVSKTHVSYLISETFKYSHIVLACVTYNLNIYPPMLAYIMDMKALNVQNRTFALIENGSWAPQSGKLMRKHLSDMKEITILDNDISVNSSVKEQDKDSIDEVVDSIIQSMK
ncbi:FprA family A-type flavoprotein [Clostridium botulinum]|uniref:Flavoprotein n=1 Tax=Clostridium botulinum (strain Hall / ATCC 3502 / NCTC 13319 / Type A) TaxID=441771 RepID=A5I5S7_CLOBH|nr:FprA family A-type flavoprotein [Clostridium botulinum]EPS48565.1 metallo-beta-lactamase/flavodoxin [Clostridium botulinum CFSAN002367]EPS49056.1 metallo-beta-lactamase/flavodoxin [Clostridium botulinum CFSAN002369]ABS34236.1 metallo-beta-lactamase family protein/flavodoxin [Clostridium botulinum A str. ATCC 19397]ABS39082.1 metallo-beta-lactamase family protein/flavodoxin [Clostridium botulinum A str. Hall]AWB18633.1 FprA family A-type flavoprotein [Clostridium botulinum]